MRKGLVVFLALALVAMAVSCSPDFYPPTTPETASRPASGQINGIWVTGEGKVSVEPDVVILDLGVEIRAPTVVEAQAEASKRMEAVLGELKAHGVLAKDIKTRRFTISPVRRWQDEEEVLLGYQVSNMVSVKIRQLEAAGSIIDAVVEAGGDAIRINSIAFTVSDPKAYYAQAREKAMADAKEKAEKLADLADVILGDPIYISEGLGYVPRPLEFKAEAAPTPISPGEVEISVVVQVGYEID